MVEQPTEYERQILAGLDLGKINDPTAFAVVERWRKAPPKGGIEIIEDATGRNTGYSELKPDRRTPREMLWNYNLDLMERWLKSDYTALGEWLAKVYSKPTDKAGLGGTILAMDYTGVGAAVADIIAKEMRIGGGKVQLRLVNITGGTKTTQLSDDRAGWNVPKKELVSVLQALMGSKRLKVAEELPNCRGLIKELDNFKVKVNADSGHESYEAWREKDHDDMVLGLAICLWVAERGSKQFWMR